MKQNVFSKHCSQFPVTVQLWFKAMVVVACLHQLLALLYVHTTLLSVIESFLPFPESELDLVTC